MMLWPSSPLLLPSPLGQTSVAEFRSTHAELRVEAHRKTILERYSVVCPVSASSTSTPFARKASLSKITLLTMEKGRSVRLPVFTAAGSVVDCVLKYAPNGQ